MSRRRLSSGRRVCAASALTLAASAIGVGTAHAAVGPAQVRQSWLDAAASAGASSASSAPASSASDVPAASASDVPAAEVAPEPYEPSAASIAQAQIAPPAFTPSSTPFDTTAAPDTERVPVSITVSLLGRRGIPAVALAAYRSAEARLAVRQPTCHLTWSLLAGIGTVESANGLYGGSQLGVDGVARPPIIGIRLDGTRAATSVVADTDGGRLDGDPVYDRAVGPMQFLPATWAALGRSAAPGRRADPENIRDAALTAGAYLCAGGADLATSTGVVQAVLRYNDSLSYVERVLALARRYEAAGASRP